MARRLLYPYPQNPTACSTNCSPACDFYLLCSPPPLPALPPPPPLSPAAAAATIHLSHSPRLPLPLLLLASTLLAISLLLLLSLLLAFLRRRLRRRHSPTAAIAEGGADFDIYDTAAAGDGDDVVHHVWYIRTVGLDDRAIAAITACVYRGGGGGAGGGGGCAVCLGEFSDGEVLRLLPKCGHAFHRQCVDTWLRAHVSCPLCRSPVVVPAAGGGAQLDSGNGVLGEQVAELSLRPPPPTSALSSVHLGAIDASSARYGERQRWRIVRRSASMGSLPLSAPLPKDWGERKFDEGSGSMDGDSPHSAKISPELEPKPEPEPAEATGTEGHGSRRFLRADMAAKDPGESDRMRG